MTTPDKPVVACIGMGVIGCGWTAHFLGQGYAVRVWDPVEGVKERLNSFLDLAWPAMTDLGLSEGADRNNFVVCENKTLDISKIKILTINLIGVIF